MRPACARAKAAYADKSYRVLRQDLSAVPATSLEIGVPQDTAVAAVERVIAQAERFRRTCWYHTSPLNLRWVAPLSNTLLAMYTGRATCMIEIPMLLGTPGADSMFSAYERILIEEFSGRPDWGKVHQHLGVDYPLPQVFPTFPRWSALRSTFNPNRVFRNAMTRRVGLDA